MKLFVHQPTVNIDRLISIQYCFDASPVEVMFLLLQIQHSAGSVYVFYQNEMGYTLGEVLTQNISKVNAPSSSKYTIVIDSIGRYYF